MIYTIGIELNHVIRNINKQMLKYYVRDYHPEIDLDEIDEKGDILNDVIKFDSKFDKSTFIYIDYPYEIFGCASTMERNLGRDITKWQQDLTNREDNEYRIIFYSLYEDELTIQSSYFFLSKIGTRIREVFFPKTIDEVYRKCTTVITANNEVMDYNCEKGMICYPTKKILINRPFNEQSKDKADLTYDSLTELIEDKKFIDKLIKPTDGE